MRFYTLFQKVDHQLLAITLSKPNRFSKFFHRSKEQKIVNKTVQYIAPNPKYVVAHLWEI